MNEKQIVFFDVDHSLIPGISAEALFGRWLLLHRLIPLGNFVEGAKFFSLNFRKLGLAAIKGDKMYLRGFKKGELEFLAKQATKELIGRRISEKGIRTIKNLQRNGKRVVLLSGSPTVIIKEVKYFVGADDMIAADLEWKNGLATGYVKGIWPYGQGKLVAAQQYAQKHGLKLADCVAYANDFADLALLKAVGRPVVINPDWRLRRWAKKHGWPLDYF